jgi:hypothetical protein
LNEVLKGGRGSFYITVAVADDGFVLAAVDV